MVISKDYKPPSVVQVNRATRKRYEKSYYRSGTCFQFSDPVTLRKFLSSISYLNRHLMQRVQLLVILPTDPIDEQSRTKFAKDGIARAKNFNMEIEMRARTKEMLNWAYIPLRISVTDVAYMPSESTDENWKIRAWMGLERWIHEIDNDKVCESVIEKWAKLTHT